MAKKPILAVVLIALAAIILWYAIRPFTQPKHFLLNVDNRSGKPVDRIRLFGSALQKEGLLTNLPPDASGSLNVAIGSSGSLRVEVSQGLNRIDTFIARDTGKLHKLNRHLVVYDGHRFILDKGEGR